MYYAKRSRHQAQALYSSLCLTYLQICTWADYGEAFSSYLCRLQHFQQFCLFLKTSYAAVWSLQDASEKNRARKPCTHPSTYQGLPFTVQILRNIFWAMHHSRTIVPIFSPQSARIIFCGSFKANNNTGI